MTLERRRFVQLAAAGGVLIAGCTGGTGSGEQPTVETTTAQTDDSGTSTANESAGVVVEMISSSFDPVRVSVDPGTTVEWVNRDGHGHDVTATRFHDSAVDWEFSETLPGEGSTTFTFDESGVYEYYCTIHGEGTMCGAVLVGDASLDASLPCESGSGGEGGDGGGGGGGPY